MKKFTLSLMVAVLALSAANAFAGNEKGGWNKKIRDDRKSFMQQQHQENKAVRKEIKDLPPAERLAAVQAQRRKQFDENKAFIQTQHEKRMAELDSRLAANTKLTADQKSSIKAQAQNQYEENLAFRQSQFEKTEAYVAQIASDTSLTPDQRRASLENFRKQQVQAAQDHFKSQRVENQEVRGAIKKS